MAQNSFHWTHLEKFRKDACELDIILEKWLYLLKNLKRLEAQPKEKQQSDSETKNSTFHRNRPAPAGFMRK